MSFMSHGPRCRPCPPTTCDERVGPVAGGREMISVPVMFDGCNGLLPNAVAVTP